MSESMTNHEKIIAELEHEIDRLTNMTYCAYCGKEFPLDDEAASQVSEHIRTCDKHPLRELEADASRLRGLLRQAYLELQRFDHVADKVLIEELAEELEDE